MSSATVQLKESEPRRSLSSIRFVSPQKQTLVLSLLLVVFTLVLYNPATHFSFINYDDNTYVYENPHVRAGLTWETLKWALTSFDQANWHPFTWISHALDCQLFGLNPAGHHFTSIVLHALNVVLLFLLLGKVTQRWGPSFVVAALFALHPLNVESVVWIAERKNVLSTTFFFLTLAAYGWYALRPGWKQYLAMAGLLVCGLASKPMLVTTPFVLVLLDYWPLARFQRWTKPSNALPFKQSFPGALFLEKAPLLLLVAASSFVTLRAQQAFGAVGTLPYPFRARLANAIHSYAEYLWQAIWPARLTVFYPWAGDSLSPWSIGLAALVLIGISCLVLLRRSRGYLLVGWLWFLGTLVPVIGVVQVGGQARADRYAYIPLIGCFVMVVWAIAEWMEEKRVGVVLQFTSALCVIAALSVATYRQMGYWRDSLAIWSHALQVTQHNYIAEDNLGVTLAQLNRADEAYPFFVRAAQDEPNDSVARLNIGTYLYQHGHRAEAIPQYQLALRLGSEPGLLAAIYANLGTAYSDLGDTAKAQASFRQALRLNPDQAAPWQGLGFLLQKEGKMEDAVSCFAHAAQLEPSGESYLQLARTLALANHPDEALAAYQQAVRLNPSLAEGRTQEAPGQH